MTDALTLKLQEENAQLRAELEQGRQEWAGWDELSASLQYKLHELQEENAKLKQDIETWARKYADSSTPADARNWAALHAIAKIAREALA